MTPADLKALCERLREGGKTPDGFVPSQRELDYCLAVAAIESLAAERDAAVADLSSDLKTLVGKYKKLIHETAPAIVADRDRLRTLAATLAGALTECAAEYRCPETTIMGAAGHVAREFKRRMDVAAEALAAAREQGVIDA